MAALSPCFPPWPQQQIFACSCQAMLFLICAFVAFQKKNNKIHNLLAIIKDTDCYRYWKGLKHFLKSWKMSKTKHCIIILANSLNLWQKLWNKCFAAHVFPGLLSTGQCLQCWEKRNCCALTDKISFAEMEKYISFWFKICHSLSHSAYLLMLVKIIIFPTEQNKNGSLFWVWTLTREILQFETDRPTS